MLCIVLMELCVHRFHTLDFIGLPKYVENGDYEVRIEWSSSEYMQFHVPSGSNIFDQVRQCLIELALVIVWLSDACMC